jgi:ornithine decarboxylase
MTVYLSSLSTAPGRETAFSDARQVVRQLAPTEPVYLFCQEKLLERARCFQQGFAGEVSYAVKANAEPRVIKALWEQGLGHFDVASLGEVEAVSALCPGAVLHFNNPVKAAEAIASAYCDHGVRSFALDEDAELEKLVRATGGATDVMYSVRFKLAHAGASYDFGSKFGAAPEQAALLLRRIAALGTRPALTFHPGSQCTEPGMYARYLAAAAGIIAHAGVEVAQINVGGGFPEQYENARVPSLQAYFDAIKDAARRFFPTPPKLMCEPGRAMVAPAVSLLARVIHVREMQHCLFVNDGVYGGMLEQSVVDLHLPVLLWRNGFQPRGVPEAYRIFGPTCDPIDRLSREVELPCRAEPGDYIEFGLLGAYGSATTTGFNGFRSSIYCNVERGFRQAQAPQPV